MPTLFERSTPNPAGYRDIQPRDVAEAAMCERLVDVREPVELRGELGHVAGAENVPLARMGEAAARFRKDEPIVLVCRSGRRSGEAAAALVAAGFSRVMNLAGGMIAWNEASLWTIVLIVFPFWSAFASYAGVRARLPVRRGRAILWFLVLPWLLFAVSFTGLAASLLHMEMKSAPAKTIPPSGTTT